jgi:hypothetical protein
LANFFGAGGTAPVIVLKINKKNSVDLRHKPQWTTTEFGSSVTRPGTELVAAVDDFKI